MNATPEQVAAGHAFYAKRTFAVYNLALLGLFSRLAWRCPALTQHLTETMLEIVGSVAMFSGFTV